MRSLLFVLLSFFIVIPVQPARADDARPGYSLTEIVDRALERSLLVRESEKLSESAIHARRQAAAWQNPSVSLSGGRKAAEGKSGPAYEAEISQPFYAPGKRRLAGEIAGIEERLAGLSKEETALYVRYSVIRLAYRYSMASGIAAHLKERIDRFSQIRTYLAGRPFPSPRKRMEKHIAEMKLILLQKSLTEVSSEKDILWARLNLFTDLPSPVTIQAPWFAKGHALDREAVLAKAARDNPALKKQLLLLEKTNAETRLARVFARPDFSLSLQYREERAPDTERFIGAGVSVPLPIWNANRDGVRSMEAAGEAGKARLEHTSRETRQALDALLIEYGIARRNIELLPLSTLESVHSRLSDADDSFRKGLIDLLTYSEVEAQAYEMHLAMFGAQMDYIDTYTALLIMQGSSDFRLPATAGKAR